MAEKFQLEFDDSAINAALQRLETTLQGTDDAFEKLRTTSQSSMKTLESSATAASKPIEELGNSVNVAAAQANLYMNRWKDSFKELTDDQKARMKSIIQTNLEFGGSVEDVEKKVKDATKSMVAENKKLQESVQKTGSSYEKLTDALKRMNSSLFNVFTRTRDFIGAAFDATKAILGMAGATTKHAKATYASSVGMTGLTKALTIGRAGLQLFRAALIATGLGAFAVAIGAVVAYLSTWQEGMDKVNRVMLQARAVIETIMDRIAKLGSAITLVFQREFKKAGEVAKEAISGIGQDIREAAKDAGNLADEMVALRKRIIELTRTRSKLRAEIEEERQISDDVNLSYKERINALESAITKNKELLAIEIEIAERQANILQERAKFSNTPDEDALAIEEAFAKVDDLRAASNANIRRDNRRLINLRMEASKAAQDAIDAEKDRVAELRKEYDKLAQSFEDRFEQAFLDSLDPVDRILAERDIAIKEIENTFEAMKAAAEAAGETLSEEVGDQLAFIIKGINDAASEAVTEAAKSSPDIIVDKWGEALDESAKQLETVAGRFRQKLADMLGLKPEELDLVFDFAREAAASITDFTAEMTQQRIDMYAAEADALRASRDEIRSELEAERNEQKLGNANRVSELEERLAAEEAALLAAEGRRLEEERKAANRRLVFDSIQQASKLALAAASVINAESSKGLIGIVTATGAIALLFSIMAGAKANAAKASQIPKLRKGGEAPELGEVKGPSHEERGIVATIDGRPVVEIEGGERIVDKRRSKKYRPFFEELKEGRYDHLDRLTVVDPTRQHKQNIRIVNPTRNHLSGLAQQIRSYETKGVEGSQAVAAALMEKAYKAAAKDATSELINYWKGRPVVRPLDGWVETWEVGSMKQRKVVRKG